MTLEQVWADIKKFLWVSKMFWWIWFVHYMHNVLQEVYFIHTNTHKNYSYNFLLDFWNWTGNKKLVPMFLSSYKTHHLYSSYYDQTSVCSKCIWAGINTVYSFYRWFFFLGSLLKGFRVLKSGNFALDSKIRLCIRRSAKIIISHVVVAGFYVW